MAAGAPHRGRRHPHRQINPVDIDRPPETARDIINRVNEITFNGSLLAETRSLERLNDVHLVLDELCAGLRELDGASRKAVLTRLARRMRAVEAARARTRRLRGMAHRWQVPRSLMDLLATEPDGERLDTRQFEEHRCGRWRCTLSTATTRWTATTRRAS